MLASPPTINTRCPSNLNTMRPYAKKRRWTLTMQVYDVGSGAMPWLKREELLKAAHRRAIDVIMVWRLDRWGRSLADLVVTLKALLTSGIPPSVSRRLGTYLRRVRRLFKACREIPSMPAARP
jgi:hypothetical protein